MTQPPPIPVVPLAYADGSQSATEEPSMPLWLTLANLAAVAVMFLPISRDSPIQALYQSANRMWNSRNAAAWAEVMILSPFLLSVVLAGWSVRLSIRSIQPPMQTWRGERIVAYCVSLASLSMSLLAMCYMLSYGREFWAAEVSGVIMLCVGAGAMITLRNKVAGYPSALIVMTTAWLTNTVMALFVVPVHHGWTLAGIAGLAIVAIQSAAAAVAVISWRERLVAAT